MGCICDKAFAIENGRESPRERQLNKWSSSELHVPQIISSKRVEHFWAKERLDSGGEFKDGFSHKKLNGSKKVRDEHFEKRKENCEVVVPNYHPGCSRLALLACHGEAIKGLVP
ncbi:hypothetical protein LOK49_LG12G00051 [Camellia lanceoleosa]|uniref:Uncharacterized protein n=1 Tax=Camellia lanceoleosa TaxID=1840588 RepID=A0ACC0FV42_9ERIC|nr:hypothetical protein LOK49_LG12G00051 [Camellia lanceoleosa]